MEIYSVDRLSLAGVWLSQTRANYIKIKVSGQNILSYLLFYTDLVVLVFKKKSFPTPDIGLNIFK